MAKALEGKVALVTGAARGIGLAIAERLASDGADLALSDVDEAELGVAATKIAGIAGRRPLIFVGDMSRQDASQGFIEASAKQFGALHILVNNAGGGIIRPFLAHTPETLRTTIDRNLWTTLWACWHILPRMREAGYGRIINIGADSVRNGAWDHAAYNAAKGGVHGLTTGLAREFANDGITVNTVAPCAVATPQFAAFVEKDPDLGQRFVGVIPMGRPAAMSEVASMVSYLASEEARFVTGQVISVNGGSTML